MFMSVKVGRLSLMSVGGGPRSIASSGAVAAAVTLPCTRPRDSAIEADSGANCARARPGQCNANGASAPPVADRSAGRRRGNLSRVASGRRAEDACYEPTYARRCRRHRRPSPCKQEQERLLQLFVLVLHVEGRCEPEILDSHDRYVGKARSIVLDGLDQQRLITIPVLLHHKLRTAGQLLAAPRQYRRRHVATMHAKTRPTVCAPGSGVAGKSRTPGCSRPPRSAPLLGRRLPNTVAGVGIL